MSQKPEFVTNDALQMLFFISDQGLADYTSEKQSSCQRQTRERVTAWSRNSQDQTQQRFYWWCLLFHWERFLFLSVLTIQSWQKKSVDYIKWDTDPMLLPLGQYNWQKRRLKTVWFQLTQHSSFFLSSPTTNYSLTWSPRTFFHLCFPLGYFLLLQLYLTLLSIYRTTNSSLFLASSWRDQLFGQRQIRLISLEVSGFDRRPSCVRKALWVGASLPFSQVTTFLIKISHDL